jgi:predicted aspartyl protease
MALVNSCGPNSFCVPIFIRSHTGSEDFAALALLDTGADHSLIPAHLVDSLGLSVVGTRSVQTANGYTDLPLVYVELQVESYDPIGVQMLAVDTQDLVAVGVDVIRRLGLLLPPGLNPPDEELPEAPYYPGSFALQ